MNAISNTDLADDYYIDALNSNYKQLQQYHLYHQQEKDSSQDYLLTDFKLPYSNFHLIEKIILCKLFVIINYYYSLLHYHKHLKIKIERMN